MRKNKQEPVQPGLTDLFDRVVSILEQARTNIVRSVNSNTVIAYWMIGREIVQALQGGEQRAEYGAHIIEGLSAQLTGRYGKGFSTANLWNFRQFYLVFANRSPEILYPAGRESHILSPVGVESQAMEKHQAESAESGSGFHPALSWSHYRALMRVEKPDARNFYESESVVCGWSKAELERQISTLYHARLLMSQDKKGMLKEVRQASSGERTMAPMDVLKDPYILEFLDLPAPAKIHESDLESAIIDKLQHFLLELGKGFSFVARQKRLRFGDDDFFVDLVFYNYLLKCFVLIDLKVGKLTHQDIGQMDSYVRLFEAHAKPDGDNPTIGLILCADRNETMARYSMLADSNQLYAAKYLLYLPTEEELKRELERERRLYEDQIADKDE